MLLLLSTIGFTSMKSAKLETLLARNMQQKQASFNNAESAAVVGESAWDEMLIACLLSILDCDNSLLGSLTPDRMTTKNGVPDIKSIEWASAAHAESNGAVYGKYTVEYLGFRKIPRDGEKIIHFYRITSRGTDSSKIANTLIQTVYRRCIKKDGLPCI